jgi:hypothetical protein
MVPEPRPFRIIAVSALANLTNMTVSPGEAKNNFILGEECSGVYYGDQLFRFVNGSFVRVQTPPGWWKYSVPESMAYGIGSNILYRYNPSTGDFSDAFTFPQHQAYQIRSNRLGLVVVGANRTVANNTTSISQNFYVFSDAANTLTLINRFNISSVLPGVDSKFIAFLVSPQLTKLLVSYMTPGNSTLRVIVKSVDYSKKSISDLPFK